MPTWQPPGDSVNLLLPVPCSVVVGGARPSVLCSVVVGGTRSMLCSVVVGGARPSVPCSVVVGGVLGSELRSSSATDQLCDIP